MHSSLVIHSCTFLCTLPPPLQNLIVLCTLSSRTAGLAPTLAHMLLRLYIYSVLVRSGTGMAACRRAAGRAQTGGEQHGICVRRSPVPHPCCHLPAHVLLTPTAGAARHSALLCAARLHLGDCLGELAGRGSGLKQRRSPPGNSAGCDCQ